MRILDSHEADQLLRGLDLKIGGWNELADRSTSDSKSKPYQPSHEALTLYAIAHGLADWMNCRGWTLMQIDNSTLPADDEVKVFEKIAFISGDSWDVTQQRTFLFDRDKRGDIDLTNVTTVLLIFFSLIFEWHVYFVSEYSAKGQRLGIQDGIIHFIGDASVVEKAEILILQLEKTPLSFG